MLKSVTVRLTLSETKGYNEDTTNILKLPRENKTEKNNLTPANQPITVGRVLSWFDTRDSMNILKKMNITKKQTFQMFRNKTQRYH